MTKTLACEVIVSEEVCASAQVATDDPARREVTIRGRDEPMTVRVVMEAKALLALAEQVEAAAA
jgi:adenylate cyclase